MKSIKLILLWFAFLFTSCDFLNVNPYFNDIIPVDSVFAKQEYVERYVWGAAGLLPTEGNLYSYSSFPYMTAVDEAVMSVKTGEFAGMYLAADEITPFSSYYNNWENFYKGIRKANTVIQRLDECKDINVGDFRDIMGMAYFLRGYFYFLLVEQYGPVPLLPEEPMDVDGSTDELSKSRNTYDECADFICSDLQKAFDFLPDTREPSFISRPTRWAALAVMSRMRLYQASPLFNGNLFYADWKTENGENFISQTPDEKKWAVAAQVAKQIINSGRYDLHVVYREENSMPVAEEVADADYPDGARNVDPYRSYAHMFNGEAVPVLNPELIYTSGMNNQQKKICFPARSYGLNYLNITQKLVDAYYMADGSDLAEGHYETTGFYMGAAKKYEDYTLGGGPRGVHNSYMNREPRFYATVGFCEAFWPATSTTEGGGNGFKNFYTDYYSDGICAVYTPTGGTIDEALITGYTCRKYINPIDHFRWGEIKAVTFPAFRYGEVLLNYVEALNELTTSHTIGDEVISRDPAEIAKYFNMIRFRAGLPGVKAGDLTDQGETRKLIQRERMIEMAHEGRRYHDLRRWKQAFDEENKPIQGMNMAATTQNKADFYQVTKTNHLNARRVFKQKMNFYPIPYGAIEQNRKLIQNPGW